MEHRLLNDAPSCYHYVHNTGTKFGYNIYLLNY